MEENKKLKPFDLEKAKAGAKVVTRDGRPVRIICWDKMDNSFPMYPIVALVKDEDGAEDVDTYTMDGACVEGQKYAEDLCMSLTTVERWVNVYKSKSGTYSYCFHESEEMALLKKDDKDYIATTKLSWEE